MKSIFTTLLMIVTTQLCLTQVSFTNASSQLQNQGLYSGFVMGVADMNGDGKDDIIRFNEAEQLEIEYQEDNASFTRNIFGPIINDKVWSLAVADVDDNGLNDLITGGFYLNPVLAKNEGSSFSFDTLIGPLIYMQAANFADINNDGLIDYFACNDDGLSNAYRHDGNTLVYDANIINTSSPNGPVNSGNYGTLWTDYDNDGDLDMYLSKCRLGVLNPMDERRINIFFENDGNDNFSDVAQEVGLRPLGQTWAIDFADIDNDGDLDAFMINHDIGSILYENDGAHHFTDITSTSGIDGSIATFPLGFQVFFEDFDNDGFVDLLLTSYNENVHPVLYINNGDKTFNPIDVFNAPAKSIQSCALGDLNSDGAVDLIAGFANGVNFPNSTIPDILLLNDGNNNNWINVTLDGFDSNKNGIGARLELYGVWGKQIREIRSGQSYGIMNSLTAHFGIGQASSIDSLVVKWPSGKRNVVFQPSINTQHLITEAFVAEQTTIHICEGEEVIIFDQPQSTSGVYYDTIQGMDIDTILQTTLVVNPVYDIFLGTEFICPDDPNFDPGIYTFNGISIDGCDSLVTVQIEEYPPYNYSVTTITPSASQDGSITLFFENGDDDLQVIINGNGIDTSYQVSMQDSFVISPIGVGTYFIEVIDPNGCFNEQIVTIEPSVTSDLILHKIKIHPNPVHDVLHIEMEDFELGGIHILDLNGIQILKSPLLIKSTLDVSELPNGTYLLNFYDKKGNPIATKRFIKVTP